MATRCIRNVHPRFYDLSVLYKTRRHRTPIRPADPVPSSPPRAPRFPSPFNLAHRLPRFERTAPTSRSRITCPDRNVVGLPIPRPKPAITLLVLSPGEHGEVYGYCLVVVRKKREADDESIRSSSLGKAEERNSSLQPSGMSPALSGSGDFCLGLLDAGRKAQQPTQPSGSVTMTECHPTDSGAARTALLPQRSIWPCVSVLERSCECRFVTHISQSFISFVFASSVSRAEFAVLSHMLSGLMD